MPRGGYDRSKAGNIVTKTVTTSAPKRGTKVTPSADPEDMLMREFGYTLSAIETLAKVAHIPSATTEINRLVLNLSAVMKELFGDKSTPTSTIVTPPTSAVVRTYPTNITS